ILFVCIENSCRSQMAEAFLNMFGEGIVNAYSCGSSPSGKVNERAITFMAEFSYDMSKQKSKSVDELPAIEYEYVITMGCSDQCPVVPAKMHEDWDIEDPKHLSDKRFREIRSTIETRVKELILRIKCSG
ncbi:MAG: arsenate reductase ArsC, partial [Gammaproteobacteria bacterium]